MKPQDSKPDPTAEPVVVAEGGAAPAAGGAAAAAAADDAVGETATPDRDDWRGAQDNPWQPDEEAPPPVIGQ